MPGKEGRIIQPGKMGKIGRVRPVLHFHQLNLLLKAIWQTPMDTEYKMCLTMRVWGVNPRIFNPMTAKQIAQFVKKHQDHTIYEYDISDLDKYVVADDDIELIKQMEKHARSCVEQYLGRVSNQEIIDRYNADFHKNQTNIFRNLGKPLK
jgi:hypothetical protein